jgi:hypothetical protein
MDAAQLKPRQWYWVRRDDGSLAPYVFHRICTDKWASQPKAEFFVGSMLQTWPIGRVVAAAEMPAIEKRH